MIGENPDAAKYSGIDFFKTTLIIMAISGGLAGLAGSLYKFAFDLRILQAQPFGEGSEPFGSRQVGSSAMPFKRNPIHAENLDSLARRRL